MSTNKENGNVIVEEGLFEYEEADFYDVLSQEAQVALDLHKKDTLVPDRTRKAFDSADYWMNKEEGGKK